MLHCIMKSSLEILFSYRLIYAQMMHNTVNVYSEMVFRRYYCHSHIVYMAQSKKTCRHSFSDGSSPPLCRADCTLGREDDKVGEKKEEAKEENEASHDATAN